MHLFPLDIVNTHPEIKHKKPKQIITDIVNTHPEIDLRKPKRIILDKYIASLMPTIYNIPLKTLKKILRIYRSQFGKYSRNISITRCLPVSLSKYTPDIDTPYYNEEPIRSLFGVIVRLLRDNHNIPAALYDIRYAVFVMSEYDINELYLEENIRRLKQRMKGSIWNSPSSQ